MAVNLLGANSAKIDFGDIANIAGLTQITVAFTIKPTAGTVTGQRFFGQWGPTSQAFVIYVNDNDELEWLVTDNSSYWGRKTSGLNLASGSTYRVVIQQNFQSYVWGMATGIWVNGVAQSLTADNSGGVSTMFNSTRTVAAGYETASPAAGVDGDYSEIAIWSGAVPSDFAAAYGIGYSPRFYPIGGLHYWPLTSTSDLADVWGSANGTNTAGTNATHPSIITPVAPTLADLTQFGLHVDDAAGTDRVSQLYVEYLASEAITTLEKAVADNVAVTESVTTQLRTAVQRAPVDNVTVTESVTPHLTTLVLRATPAESASVVDAVTARLALVKTRADAVTVVDAVTVELPVQGLSVRAFEAIALSELRRVITSPISIRVADRVRVTELSRSPQSTKLAVHAFEAIHARDTPLHPNGAVSPSPAGISPEPTPVASLADYWVVGI